jgi:hypothetical protein
MIELNAYGTSDVRPNHTISLKQNYPKTIQEWRDVEIRLESGATRAIKPGGTRRIKG